MYLYKVGIINVSGQKPEVRIAVQRRYEIEIALIPCGLVWGAIHLLCSSYKVANSDKKSCRLKELATVWALYPNYMLIILSPKPDIYL
jgi:hypothetical protein